MSVEFSPDIPFWYDSVIVDGNIIVGWTVGKDGEKFYYNANIYLPTATEGYEETIQNFSNSLEDYEIGVYDLYPITVPAALLPEDVYGFTNSEEYFDVDGRDKYYMTKEHYLRLVSSACIASGVGPLSLPSIIASGILSTYKDWSWTGSCIGFTSTVCLQKKGILDVVGTQPGAKCMRDLKPTDELISLINYYNGQSFTSAMTKNKAYRKADKEYSRQLKKMYESAASGNLVLLEFFTGPEVGTDYHGLAVSGAYTDKNGVHILLCYDDNFNSFAQYGQFQHCYISPDFTQLYTAYDNGDSLGFVWTDDFESYRSLDINGVTNPLPYRISYLNHVFEIIKEWIEYYILGIFK